jgi:glycosyltransferase involved in cell wall biosynthesis
MPEPTVGLAIPSIAPRAQMLRNAFSSALRQTRPFDAFSIAIDTKHEGAPTTRERAWRALGTDYVAFLDDDDLLCSHHLATLLAAAVEHDADLVYPHFDVEGGIDPFDHWGKPWDAANPVQTTITVLWKREALEKVGGFLEEDWDVTSDPGMDENGNRAGEDFRAVCRLNARGGRIVHVPEKTWVWRHWGGNSSGLPGRVQW